MIGASEKNQEKGGQGCGGKRDQQVPRPCVHMMESRGQDK